MDEQPITELQFFAYKTNIPSDAIVLTRTYFGNDMTLVYESGWLSKQKRFLCFRRDPYKSTVITDISVLSESANVQPGYQLVSTTIDTGEKVMKKCQVAVRIESRSSASSAITHIAAISMYDVHSPHGYYVIRVPISDYFVCFRRSALNISAVASSTSSLYPSAAGPVTSGPTAGDTNRVRPNSFVAAPIHDLSGVPFQIMSSSSGFDQLGTSSIARVIPPLDQVLSRTTYNFSLERSIAN